ncbi:MAG: hypothetical protein A3C79_02050 [Candidatus Taylorbacteria bacterium RIFCSPHIGHO2_02_FULL_45_28]|uniref:Nudix hydrolase domain-containing protein n=1 Tax=Candidatus Taylorbacteria bacterium RIFCSPHIGHO2_12_FULL_45_16 TaxID=1802315 RepID=A0A1G2N007_9BACT|nr:MAG: hypothetical protein A2830_02855 [Candidatus Taylorbacteria bacterium RIFCSPHIGHO2_01_FULL_44_110]OHA25233.1 MAG: hypothetical protein A3C79_02050 [Candidatus Taylorbacteria bacterium RIFCSPHIGHO2_02_FULL_45_28]OHA29476.1 MAG: hypothetical protein A3F51_00360 [Candidatus Taylorbacteria bacterium RIFCSPHIGHO2_12_FULL_45_16]OHA33238.1 MAG: hypothetical protein A3A23_02890 [Candidatus Taylorbacteria bacterium RIFCSPLOWO2_01_FULL_45_59]OHA38287.1 MAG: hypothetical protein A3I98_03155 [Candi
MKNLWENHPIATKHHIGLIDASNDPYSLRRATIPHTPELQKRVRAWRDGAREPFPARDMEYHKAAFGDFREEDNCITYFPASWAEYTIMRDKSAREALPPQEQFRFLAVCGVVETTDRHYALSLRSKNVATHKDVWHVSAAGSVELSTVTDSRGVIFQFFQELHEELGVLPCDIVTVKQLGLCDHLYGESPSIEVCMCAKIELDSHELLERSKTARDSWEGKIHTFPIDTVHAMLSLDSKDSFNPAGVATLILALGL